MSDFKEYVLPNIIEKRIIDQAIAFFSKQELLDFPLSSQFKDAGVYGLFYFGKFEPYSVISNFNNQATKNENFFPIYIGKAVPPGSRKGRTKKTAFKTIYNRLQEHSSSIKSVNNLKISDFKYKFVILRDNEIDLIAPLESELIRKYSPLWNSNLPGFGIHVPGKGRNLQAKSEWDTFHPGREIAHILPKNEKTIDQIIKQISDYSEKLTLP